MSTKLKRNVMPMLLALLVVSSTVVFAAGRTYSFVLAIDAPIAYSASYVKSIETDHAYVQQTGSSPGYYSVTYTVVANDSAKTPLTFSKAYQGTDYTTKEILYLGAKQAFSGSTLLKGVYGGNSIHTVAGQWNPNGLIQ